MITLSARVSLKVRFRREPVSESSQRRTFTERAGKTRGGDSPPAPLTQLAAKISLHFQVPPMAQPALEGFVPSSRTWNQSRSDVHDASPSTPFASCPAAHLQTKCDGAAIQLIPWGHAGIHTPGSSSSRPLSALRSKMHMHTHKRSVRTQ